MRLIIINTFILPLLISSSVGFSNTTDSLKKQWLNKNHSISQRYKSLDKLIYCFEGSNLDSALYYSKILIDFAVENKSNYWILQGNSIRGGVYYNMDMPDSAMHYFELSYALANKLKAYKDIIRIRNNIANIYADRGQNNIAISHYQQNLKMAYKHQYLDLLSESFYNMGLIYEAQEEYAYAVGNFKEALKIYTKEKDYNGQIKSLISCGLSYGNLSKTDSAYQMLADAKTIALRINDLNDLSDVYTNTAIFFKQQKSLDSSITYHLKALEIRTELKNNTEIAGTYVNLAIVYAEKGDFKNAISYGEKGKNLLTNAHRVDWLRNAYQILSYCYKKTGNIKSAFEMYEKYIELKDSLSNKETQAQLLKHSFEIEYTKKAATDSLRVLEERKIHLLQSKKEKLQRYILYGGIGFIFIVATLIFWRFRASQKQRKIIEIQKKKVEHQKQIIEEKHQEITDSINYAERLQRSLMASTKLLDKHLKDYFIYFNPKEKVSGDFYWCSSLSNNRFLLACADSTGHGVPGAIMSMMNMNSLNESVKENLIEPAQILNRTREIIINTLKNDGTAEGGKDGMDCALLSFDFNSNVLSFALANNPLWLVRNGELKEYKPDKTPVGKHDKDHIPFTQKEIELQKNDLIILLTDGFADQFGGDKGKKFKYSNLQQLILDSSGLPLDKMKYQLEQSFEKWRGELEQVDDVCIVGVKI